jgi:hypothetical protein
MIVEGFVSSCDGLRAIGSGTRVRGTVMEPGMVSF